MTIGVLSVTSLRPGPAEAAAAADVTMAQLRSREFSKIYDNGSTILRRWVRKPPSEYLHERFLFTTQPCDEPDDPSELGTLVSMLGHNVLCFSTDYPHRDNDMPAGTLQMLAPAARRAVFFDNAARGLRL